jgi:AcrR family transcriptional regulator
MSTVIDHNPVRWRRRKDARPQELLEAAFSVFVAKGFADARLDDIAAKAGVSKGTVYLYFDSKEAVFKAMISQVADEKLEMLSQLVEAHQGSFAALIRQLAQMMAAQISMPPLVHFPRLIIGESRRFPELAAFYLETAISRGVRSSCASLSAAKKPASSAQSLHGMPRICSFRQCCSCQSIRRRSHSTIRSRSTWTGTSPRISTFSWAGFAA